MEKKQVGENNKECCFVIMPFGGYFDTYFKEIFKPAIENLNLIPKRADDIYRPGTIVQDIWNYTKKARIILADLTGKNPNVFYELGLAHSLAKPVILITNTMEDVPFDLRALRVITYNKNSPNWGQFLQDKIESAIKETLESPISSVLPAFMDTQKAAYTKISITEKDFIELKRDYELLKTELKQNRIISDDIEEISMEEVRQRLIRYIEQGYATREIINRLKVLGVPTNLIIDEINIIRKNNPSLLDNK